MKLEVLKRVVDRFWAKVNKNGRQMPGHEAIGNCWEWTAALSEKRGGSKYGAFNLPADETGRRPLVAAHRFSLAISGDGVIPDDMDCCHRCDNPLCVRPSHLFWATHRANMADYAAKHGGIAVPKLNAPLTPPRRLELVAEEPLEVGA